MHKLWDALKHHRHWFLIILGLVLIIFAVFNLFADSIKAISSPLEEGIPIDQEGFAPIIMPKPSLNEIPLMEQPASPSIPDRIIIESINLDAPVEVAKSVNVNIDGREATQFLVPEKFAAGWHEGSAPLGVIGNTVISGHHNAYGEVFKRLSDLEVGDAVKLFSGEKEFDYVITNKMVLLEKDQPIEERLENARWILPSDDERVTLVTCWPERSNTHRLILVARPLLPSVQQEEQRPHTSTESETMRLTEAEAPYPYGDNIEPIPNLATAIRLSTPAALLIQPNPATPYPSADKFIVRSSGQFSVNIRELPSIESKILGSLKAGDEADGIGRAPDGMWIFIEYQKMKGWVNAEVVQVLTGIDSLPMIEAPYAAP